MGVLMRIMRRLRYGRPIVVVSGLPRSGTSMMMQMLQAGGIAAVTDAIRTADASNPKGYYELEAVKDLDKGIPPAWLADARGKAVKIVSSLVRWLPETNNYQVIFMQRNLDEVITSQNRMLVDRGAPADTSQDEHVRRQYQSHVEQTLRLLRGRRSVSLLVVDYGEAVARPEETAQRIDRFLGGGLDVHKMAATADATLHRNRRSGG
jgi:sulfotransferase family protein